MDWNVGRVIDRIEEAGQRENTLICFLSDNGFNCGHHGIWGKGNGTYPQNMYDTSVKVPAIFSKEWKYVRRYPDGPDELYDLLNDPDEKHNRIDDAGCREIIEQYSKEMNSWFDTYADPDRDGRKENITGKGQIEMVGVKGQGRKAFYDGE